MIRLAGPGGAGKTTAGAVLAEALGFGIYMALPDAKIETMRPPAHVAADTHAVLLPLGRDRNVKSSGGDRAVVGALNTGLP